MSGFSGNRRVTLCAVLLQVFVFPCTLLGSAFALGDRARMALGEAPAHPKRDHDMYQVAAANLPQEQLREFDAFSRVGQLLSHVVRP